MQKKLIISLILYVIVMSVGLGVLSTIAVNGAIERSLQKSLTSAHTIANQLDFLLQTNISRLYDISLSGKVNLTTGNMGPIKQLLESIYQYSIFTEGVFLVDKQGDTLLSYPARDYGKENLLFIPWVSRVLTEGRPIISNVYTIEPIKKPLIFILVPLRNAAGEVVGAAGGAINPTNSVLSRLLRAVTSETENHYIEIIDSNEIVIASDRASHILVHHDHDGILSKMIKDHESGINHCNHGFSKNDGKTQDELAVVPLESVSWAIVFGQARDEVYQPAHQLRNKFFLLALIFIATAVIFSIGISRNIVSPIRSLITETNRIGQGDLSVPVGNIGSDEISVLGQSFDDMREQLAKSRESIQRQNIELEERVKSRTRQLEEKQIANTTLLKQLITSQEDERKRIARELHDESLQTLSAILMNIDMCLLHPEMISPGKVTSMKETVMKVINEMSKVIQNLRPTVLDDLGFEAGIVWLADRNLKDKNIRCYLNMSELVEERISPEMQITLFRIIQETTMNIARHSEAENVFINIRMNKNKFTMIIEDDGVGFDPASALENLQTGRGLGIRGMKERATQVNGELNICSTVGEGTIVQCSVPLTREG
ncbi:MAG: HAMP domain-containing protein [Nitrospirota bacterium]